MVQFHLVHFCVQVPTWWWSKSPSGLIDDTGLCIDFIDSGLLSGIVSVNLFVALATHKFPPGLLELLWIGLSSNKRTVLGDHRLSALSPALSPVEVGFWDLVVINLFSRSIRTSVYSNDSIKLSIWLRKCLDYQR